MSVIKIDRKEYRVRESVLTGAQLRRLPEPDIGADRDLFEVVPGGSDSKISIVNRRMARYGRDRSSAGYAALLLSGTLAEYIAGCVVQNEAPTKAGRLRWIANFGSTARDKCYLKSQS